MTIVIECQCGKRLKVPDTLAGQRAKCPGCGEVLQLPSDEAAPTSDLYDLAHDPDASDESMRRCPVCKTEYAPGVIVCVSCGIHMDTGQQYTMSTVRPPDADEDDDAVAARPSWSRLALIWTAEHLPGLFRPLVLIGAILLGAVGLAITVFGIVLILGFFAIFAGGACVAVGALAYAQAVAFILIGEFMGLVAALVDFNEMQWVLWFTLLMLPGAILLICVNSL